MLAAALEDAESRDTLRNVTDFHISGDHNVLVKYDGLEHLQYFDFVVPVRAGDVFVDVGGFDGDTVERFAAWNPAYAHIHVFEPDPVNAERLRAKSRSHRNVTLHQHGLASYTGSARFRHSDGPRSALEPDGDTCVSVAPLDQVLEDPVSFIKMDIEGGELDALAGAKGHIASGPVLAIAVYHHISDMRRIWQYVMSIYSHYAVYLRHYTAGWAETVMYFVSRS
jgi:FkbM family methyltransferase